MEVFGDDYGDVVFGCGVGGMERRKGVATAVFPSGPERTVYNNAVLDRGLGASERRAALDAMEVAYASAGVDHFAAWVHESDVSISHELLVVCLGGVSP